MIKQVRLMVGDRRRRQRGSVLSGLLIVVAFLSILIGGLMTELTTAFLVSRAHTARVAREATATSAAESAINNFQRRLVPPRCATDRPEVPQVTLNGSAAAGTSSCTAIVPEPALLTAGASQVDGVHDTSAGRNRYLVGDSSGLYSYRFGETSRTWWTPLGGALTAPPVANPNPAAPVLLVPVAKPGSSCSGNCVSVFRDNGLAPVFRCDLGASARVTNPPAVEGTNFPGYAFFADSAGNLYVYDTRSSGCNRLSTGSRNVGGRVVGAPMVFPGRGNGSAVNDHIFVVVTDGSSTTLQHWVYSESNTDCNLQEDGDCEGGNVRGGGTAVSLVLYSTQSLTGAIGGGATGYAASSTTPPLSLAVVSSSGKIAIAQINRGPSYNMALGPSAPLPSSIGRSPFWSSQNVIGVGGTNGTLYLLNTSLVTVGTYDGQADGRPAINSTPAADVNGNWYFGAADGYVYNVEIPALGAQMFKAARFGSSTGATLSSLVVGSDADGCTRDPRLAGPTPCLYFASSTSGAYFARMGSTRVLDLRVECVSLVSDPTICLNPKLWAQVEVGSGVKVRGWSYYAP